LKDTITKMTYVIQGHSELRYTLDRVYSISFESIPL